MGATISRSVKKFMQDVEKDIDMKMKDSDLAIGTMAVRDSPVITGAFVTSWTISDASNKGRARTSRGKPPRTESEAKSEAQALIEQDANSLPEDTTRFYVNNRAPHAKGALKNRPDFFEQVKASALQILKEKFR
jgi:uncharacterized protein (DUF1778 family)